MRPHWESLLPSNLTDWVVITCSCAPVPADAPLTLREQPGSAVFFLRSTTSTGPSCLLVGACVHYLWSCCLYLWKCTATGVTHHLPAWRTSQLLTSLSGHQLNRHEWPDLWTTCHLRCDPSHQVWLWKNRRAMMCSHTRRVSKLERDGFIDLASCRPNAHPMVLG